MDPQQLELHPPLNQELDLTDLPDRSNPPDRWTHASAFGQGPPQPTHLAASAWGGDAAAGTDGGTVPGWLQHATGVDGAAAAMYADPCLDRDLSPPTWAGTASASACHRQPGGLVSASAHTAGRPPPCGNHAHALTVGDGDAAHVGPPRPVQAAEAAAGPTGRAPRRRSAETQRGSRGTVSLRRRAVFVAMHSKVLHSRLDSVWYDLKICSMP